MRDKRERDGGSLLIYDMIYNLSLLKVSDQCHNEEILRENRKKILNL